jgi:hypothetical protein
MRINPVKTTTRYIADNSDYVAINMDAISDFVDEFEAQHIKHWMDEAPFDIKKLKKDDKLNFLLLFNSMSFSYWGDPKWNIEYKGKSYDGSWGMIAALARALEKEESIIMPENWSNITKKEFGSILKGNTKIPLFEERLKFIKQIGSFLKLHDGQFSNIIKESEGDVLNLLALIIKHFSSFEDSSIYKGKKVHFYKRAQLLISDIYQAFHGEGYGKFSNIQELTACADYKLPQMLRKHNILEYSKALATKIDNRITLLKDSKEENEIRANTIWSVESIKDEIRHKIPTITSININDRLWLLSQEKNPDDKPYHLTRTTAY